MFVCLIADGLPHEAELLAFTRFNFPSFQIQHKAKKLPLGIFIHGFKVRSPVQGNGVPDHVLTIVVPEKQVC